MTQTDTVADRRWDWVMVPASRGAGSWLVQIRDDEAWVVAPPAVGLRTAERYEELSRWRLCHGRLRAPGWLSPNDPASWGELPGVIETAALLHLLPVRLHGWVERVMLDQLVQCAAFARSQPGTLQQEERARAAAQRLLELRTEFRAAFPQHEPARPGRVLLPEVPRTGDELLFAMTRQPPRQSRWLTPGTLWVRWRFRKSRRSADE